MIDAYGATHVDFDIEGAAIGNTAANTRRAQAIAKLQQADPGARRHLHAADRHERPDAAGLRRDRDAVNNGVDIAAVNIMAMNYSGVGDPDREDGRVRDPGRDRAARPARDALPGALRAQRWRKVGVTPMIGVNDFADQVFTVQDARDVAAWAATQHIGMLGMWSLAIATSGENWAFSERVRKTFTD